MLRPLRQRLGLMARQAQSTLAAAQANFLWDPSSTTTVPSELARWALEAPDDPFLWFGGRWMSVGEFDRAVNRAARTWSAWGLRRKQVVALMLDNSPDYLVHMYALFKLGAVAALINPALQGEALAHVLAKSAAKALAVDANSWPSAAPVVAAPAIECFSPDDDLPLVAGRKARNFSTLSAAHSEAPLPSAEHLRLGDLAAYIFTSGTTGLPKPALVKHHRLWRGGQVFGGLIQFTRDDTMYCCLPLYHANASVISTCTAITHRGRLALAPRFSARAFWRDCIESGATSFIYVGELVRYLVNRAPAPDEQAHGVTKILGNGLAADLWPEVQSRFGIDRIAEYYAATEGNAETLNLFNREASMGPLMPWKMAVVRWDERAQSIERDARGRAVKVRANEPGLLLGKIAGRNEYAGYADKKASRAKVLRDVFRQGDAWFNTGDLVAFDRTLHMRFVDRLGDTFRWKSENVSTREVSELLTSYPGVAEACVYGVKLPGHEGRAGMAAIVVNDHFDPATLFEHLSARLPRYAHPRFLRVVESLEVTGSFKHRKLDLVRQGIDELEGDALWIWSAQRGAYAPCERPSEAQLAAL